MSSKVAIGIAAVPERSENLGRVVKRLLPQCDRLTITLNGWGEREPDIPTNKKIVLRVKDTNIGSQVKFACCYDWDGYCLSVDDDILYPPDYVKRMTECLDKFGRKAIVGVHGSIANPDPIHGFMRRRKIIHFRAVVGTVTPVLFVGAGTACFHTDHFRIYPEECEVPNISDTYLMCLSAPMPHYIIDRGKAWLKQLDMCNVANYKRKPMPKIEEVARQYREELLERYTSYILKQGVK